MAVKKFVEKYIPPEEIELFNEIRAVLEKMEEPNLGFDEEGREILPSCHMLVRAMAKVFPQVKVQDGYYSRRFSHSWLKTKSGHLIDLYPVAMVGGPLMMDGGEESPSNDVYIPFRAVEVGFGKFSKTSFRRSIRRLVKAIEKARK